MTPHQRCSAASSALVILFLCLAVEPANGRDRSALAQPLMNEYQSAMHPDQLRNAIATGRLDTAAFPILRELNPYYVMADFDGDSKPDLAVWVR